MTGRLGVLVAVLALSATASARPKSAPTTKAPAAPVEAPPADNGSAGDGNSGSAAAQASDEPPHITGPQHVELGHDCQIELPAGTVLLEHDEAKKIIERGGGHADNIVAMIFPIGDDNQTWEMSIDYDDVGYVSDKDADELDPAALLKQYQEGTEQDNQQKRALGKPELFLDGWNELPKYDKTSRRLVWGFNAHTIKRPNVNYFTRILGRNGYMSVDLIDSPDRMQLAKQQAAGVIGSTSFKTGATYADHKQGDKDSGMGLKALVLGGAGVVAYSAVKGGGLIALLIALKKGIIVLVLGIGAFFKKIFGRTKKVQLPPDGPPPSDGPPVG